MNFSLMIEARLLTDDEFLYKCLVCLYDNQEDDEQDMQTTVHQNGHGFNTADAPILTQYAEELREDGALCSEHLVDCRERMKKYCKQLTQYLTEDEIL